MNHVLNSSTVWIAVEKIEEKKNDISGTVPY